MVRMTAPRNDASIDHTAAGAPTPGERLDGLLNRLGADRPIVRDVLFALVVAAITVGLFGTMARLAPADPNIDLTSTEAWTATGIATGQALLLSFRRLRPSWCFAAVAACQVAIILVAPEIMGRGLSPAIAAYTVGSLATARFTIAAVAVALSVESVAAMVATWGSGGATLANHVASGALLYGGAAFVGVHMAARRRNAALAREQAAEAIRAQRQRAEAAITAERTRLARELHDVAAHHLSGMVIQAAAVERLIGRDAEAAKSGAAWIRAQGKETLANLRQVVGLLRDRGEGEEGRAPVPGLSALNALIEEAEQLGDKVTLQQEGSPLVLPPIADISLYRIAQQSLTNARQHAPGAPVSLRLAYEKQGVVVEVVNGTSTKGELANVGNGGTGLVGMRERADLVGADFEAGPKEDGGWRVHVRLQVQELDQITPDEAFATGERK